MFGELVLLISHIIFGISHSLGELENVIVEVFLNILPSQQEDAVRTLCLPYGWILIKITSSRSWQDLGAWEQGLEGTPVCLSQLYHSAPLGLGIPP